MEPLVGFTESYARGRVVVYEDMCLNPVSEAKRLYEYVGWHFDDEIEHEIMTTCQGSGAWTDSRKGAHSIQRDPKQMMMRWKDSLDKQQIADIAAVVADSGLLRLWAADLAVVQELHGPQGCVTE